MEELLVWLVVDRQDEGRGREGNDGETHDNHKHSHIRDHLPDCLDQVTILSEDSEVVEALQPEEEGTSWAQISLPVNNASFEVWLLFINEIGLSGDVLNDKWSWDNDNWYKIHYIPYVKVL